MKTTLNLLPKSKEKKIRNKKIWNFIILQEIMIIFTTVLFFGVVKGVDTVASFQLNSLNQQLSQNVERSDYVEIKRYEDKLGEIKGRVDFVRTIQNFNINWTLTLTKLAEILPREIVVEAIDSEGYAVTLRGVAQNRDALIRVKEALEKDGCFKEINIPLNNIVLRENIAFELSFIIDEKCILNYEKK